MTDDPTIFTDKAPETRWLGVDLGREEYSGFLWYQHAMEPTPRPSHYTPPPSKVVTVDFLCRHRCDVHGRTNHVVEYEGRIMCVECNQGVTRKAMAENVRYDR